MMGAPMSPFAGVLFRYAGNVAIFAGLLISCVAGWDYLRGPAAGEAGPAVGVVVGVLAVLIGWRLRRGAPAATTE